MQDAFYIEFRILDESFEPLGERTGLQSLASIRAAAPHAIADDCRLQKFGMLVSGMFERVLGQSPVAARTVREFSKLLCKGAFQARRITARSPC